MPLIVFIFYTLLAAVFLQPLFPVWSSGIPGGLEDTRLFLWNAWWFRYATHTLHTSPYFTRYLFYPFGSSLVSHDYPLWTNLVTCAGQAMGLNIIAASNTWFILTWVLTAFFVYLLVWEITRTRAPAIVAGLYVMTNSFFLARAMQNWGYCNLFGLALFVWLWMRAHRTGRRRDYVWSGLALAWTAACQYYYVIYGGVIWLAGILADVSPWRLRVSRGPVRHAWLVPAILGGGVGTWIVWLHPAPLVIGRAVIGLETPANAFLVMWVGLVAWFLSHYRWMFVRVDPILAPAKRRERLVNESTLLATALAALTPLIWGTVKLSLQGGYPRQSIQWKTHLLGANLLAVFMPNPVHAVWGQAVSDWFWARGLNPQEEAVRIGWVCLAVVIWSWTARRTESRRWLWLAIGSTVLGMGVYLHVAQWNTWLPLPFYIWRLLPVLNNVRVPERWMAVGSIAWSVVLAWALIALARKKNWNLTLLCSVVGALVLIENWPGIPVAPPPPDPPAYEVLRKAPPGAVLPVPLALRDSAIVAGDAGMAWVSLGAQIYHQHPILGGCIGRISRQLIKSYKADPFLLPLLNVEEGKPDAVAAVPQTLACRSLRTLGVSYVLLYPQVMNPATAAFIRQSLPLESLQKDPDVELYRLTCR